MLVVPYVTLWLFAAGGGGGGGGGGEGGGGEAVGVLYFFFVLSLWKHAFSNVLKILQQKKENFQIKNQIFFIFLLEI